MVDILLATYNGEKFIIEQFDSILNQTYQDFRIIIRDDGSTDSTVSIIKKYEMQYPQKIRVVQDDVKCGSSVSNFFQLMKYAESPYVMFSDQDDVWLEHKIEVTYKKVKEIEARVGKDKPVLVFGDYKPVDNQLNDIEFNSRNNQITSYKLDFNHLLVQNYVTGCLVMMNECLYKKMGEYSSEILMHDWWAALYASMFGEVCHVPEVVMLYRQHGNNCVGAVDVKSFKYRFGKFIDKETKYAQDKYREQAYMFLKRYICDFNDIQRIQVINFIDLFSCKNKLVRIFRLIKGKYLKSDIVRIIGQLWYI